MRRCGARAAHIPGAPFRPGLPDALRTLERDQKCLWGSACAKRVPARKGRCDQNLRGTPVPVAGGRSGDGTVGARNKTRRPRPYGWRRARSKVTLRLVSTRRPCSSWFRCSGSTPPCAAAVAVRDSVRLNCLLLAPAKRSASTIISVWTVW